MIGPIGTTRMAHVYIHYDNIRIYIYVIGTIHMIKIYIYIHVYDRAHRDSARDTHIHTL